MAKRFGHITELALIPFEEPEHWVRDVDVEGNAVIFDAGKLNQVIFRGTIRDREDFLSGKSPQPYLNAKRDQSQLRRQLIY